MFSCIRRYMVFLQPPFDCSEEPQGFLSIISGFCRPVLFFPPVLWSGWSFFTPVASFQTDYRHWKKQSKLPVMYSGEKWRKVHGASWKKNTFDTLGVHIIAGVSSSGVIAFLKMEGKLCEDKVDCVQLYCLTSPAFVKLLAGRKSNLQQV